MFLIKKHCIKAIKGFINQVREIKEKERMVFLANMQKEIEKKKEQVEMETASKFYEKNIKDKFKIFYLILKTQSLNTYMKYNKIKRILVNSFIKRLLHSFKEQTKISIQRDNDIINKFNIRRKYIRRVGIRAMTNPARSMVHLPV